MSKANYCHLALAVIETEAQAIQQLANKIDQRFEIACDLLFHCQGRIIVTGMGKSGHIAGKIAATLASTGSPAFFVHPGEASHGDMGMITQEDVVIALSNSGETDELMTMLPLLKRLNVPLITLTGNPNSNLAHGSTITLDVSVEKEACPLGLAPTASTTAALVMGDALAVALLTARGFGAEDFALSHPGGRLGRRLLIRVNDLMRQGDQIPCVDIDASLGEALVQMTEKQLGMTLILDKNKEIQGIFTDGDLRRMIDRQMDIHNTPLQKVMTPSCKMIPPDALAAEALQQMESHRVTSLVVSEDKLTVIGVIHMHDLMNARVY